MADPGQAEREIREIPGVVGVLFLDGPRSDPVELQVFIGEGTTEQQVRQRIAPILASHGLMQSVERIFVFGFEQAPGRGSKRPLIGNITLTTAGPTVEAQVSLFLDGKTSDGYGSGPRSAHSLRVVAATTLEAAQAFLGKAGMFALQGVSLVEVLGQQVVIVLVHSVFGEGSLVLGASLVGDSEAHEAAVRASLDAVNRHMSFMLR